MKKNEKINSFIMNFKAKIKDIINAIVIIFIILGLIALSLFFYFLKVKITKFFWGA